METGSRQKDLADKIGVSNPALSVWKKKFPEFDEACKRGVEKWKAAKVEKALLRRCTGYTYEEVSEEAIFIAGTAYIQSKERIQDGTNKKGKPVFKKVDALVEGVKRKVIIKTVQPSDIAIMFFLQNRMPERWKNVQRSIVESHNVNENRDTFVVDLSKALGKDELEEYRRLAAKLEAGKNADAEGTGPSSSLRIA